MTTIAVPMIIFYRWQGVENTVGAISAEYTLGNAPLACFRQPFPLSRRSFLLLRTGPEHALCTAAAAHDS